MAAWLDALARSEPAVWLRPPGPRRADRAPLRPEELAEAKDRFARFAPVLAQLFPGSGWDGRIRSLLLRYPSAPDLPPLWVKADHALPMTGSVKARGGVYEVLVRVEGWAAEAGVVRLGGPLDALADPEARKALAGRRIVVASTGNLGFSIGVAARAFGIEAEVHMSRDAKAWKKDRLRAAGALVVEHEADYGEACARARAAAAESGAALVDDERSRLLFVGYACAADELAEQLEEQGVSVDAAHPLVVTLPCGVGGAPGGVAAGLKARFGDAAFCVTVEPAASPCMLAALAGGGEAVSIYDLGLDNRTVADGLAVARASELVLDAVGARLDGAAALPDAMLLDWTRRAWREAGLRLEPSASAALAALGPLMAALRDRRLPGSETATHVAWLTGGAALPDAEFEAVLAATASAA